MRAKFGEGLEGNDSVVLQRDLFKVLQLQLELAMSAPKFMFCADGCDGNASWDGHSTGLPFFK